MIVSFILWLFVSPDPAPRERVIVTLRQPEVTASAGTARQRIAAAQQAVLDDLSAGDLLLTDRWTNLSAFAGEITPQAAQRLRNDPRVESVIPDLPGGGALLESGPLIGANVVRAMGYSGAGVTVAVLDSGIDLGHPDFAGRVVGQACFCRNFDGTGCCPDGQAAQSGDGAGADDHGHGTNVAGVIASASSDRPGIAPGASLVVVKVLDRFNRFAGLSQVISGIDWVISNHPEVRVMNMSLLTDALLTSRCDSSVPPITQAAEVLRERGGLMIACSGNGGSRTSLPIPACVGSVMAVGAVYDIPRASATFFGCTDAPAATDQVTCFTNANADLDILGPGVQVTTSGRGGGTSTFTGTSQAAPHVAGAAAILFAIDPDLSAEAAESVMKRTGKPVFDARTGHTVPRLDLLSAVQAVQKPSGPRRRAVGR